MPHDLPNTTWESMYAPYGQATYQSVLHQITLGEVILDIGAGDLRLARQMAALAQKVYALEIAPELFSCAAGQKPLPENIIPICADARRWDFPHDITTGVLLMRHCTHFQLYAEKLLASGAQRLITNARWGMAVETIHLAAPRLEYKDLQLGWYACWCGSTGFKPGLAHLLTEELTSRTFEVYACPNCSARKAKAPNFAQKPQAA